MALVGPNGTGKTTVLRCITGADQPTEGTVELNGRLFDERSPAVRAELAIVMDIDFFPDLSVVEHLDLIARAHSVADAEAVVDDVLEELGLLGPAGQLPGTLSSGQRRRLALASAFVRPRRLLILDEPEQRLDEPGLDWLAQRLLQEKRDGLGLRCLAAGEEPSFYDGPVPERIMFVHLKTGYNADAGPSWIARVRFSKSWQTAYFRGKTLRRLNGLDSNFYDVENHDEYWVSGPKRDLTDGRYSAQAPTIDDDAREAYEAFLDDVPLPGREHG